MRKFFAVIAAMLFIPAFCGCGAKKAPETGIKLYAECDGVALEAADYAVTVSLNGEEQTVSAEEGGYFIALANSGEITGTVMYPERVQVSFGTEYNADSSENARIKISLSHSGGALLAEQTFTATENGKPIERKNSAEAPLDESILSVSEIKE